MRIARRGVVSALLGLLSFVATPWLAAAAFAQSPTVDAQLYELTENMKLARGKLAHRRATSELMGLARVDTPLCPWRLVAAVNPRATSCTVNATASDNISLVTGLGNFGGKFTVVVQGDNPVDSPEFVIAKGKFQGKMDFSPAILYTVPLGSVVGEMVVDGQKGAFPFTGTFRLPFVLGPTNTPKPLRDALNAYFGGSTADAALGALLRWGPLPLAPFPTAFYTDQPDTCPKGIDSCSRPLYLNDDGSVLPVEAAEYGLGYPTVKFEIRFR